VTDNLTPERRSENMSRIRAKGTSPELIVRRLVHGMGFRFRLHVAKLPGRPDLVLTRLGKIIEVRGCFWHQHKGCIDSHIPKSRIEYWRPKLMGNARRDRQNEKELCAQGWAVLTIWECEAKDVKLLQRKIKSFLRERRRDH
jgi:DNA mismatch endonuclease (patch repair protein)